MAKQSKVYFIPTADTDDLKQINSKLQTLLAKVRPFQKIKKDSLVALKMHFGEEENKGYLNPYFISTIVKELKKIPARVFLTDTNALYKGSRTNTVEHLDLAYRHGFTPEKVGAPVVISDGIKSDEDREIKIKGDFIKTAYIASGICKADCLVVVSHFKGHIVTGFGGAIKNLGMGCASRRGKLIQHGGIAPVVYAQKCVSCGACVENCPVEAIKYVEHKAKINPKICIGCASCIAACPVAAIDVQWEKGADILQEKMVEYAKAAVKDKEDNCVYLNFAVKITKECDCLAKDDPKVVSDIGIFLSFDPVAIDQASADKVNETAGKDIIKELHPERDWKKQLARAEKIKLGSCVYELVKIQ
ncbi:MAG: DUF362 domain-containing protein [Candidatus Omnitrophica bacterium]|nr:DUF362 domain-containing protein [Candidatus Omnitrophota bacterium]